MTKLSLDQFVSKYNGKYKDVDRDYGPQCWDLVEAYAEEVFGLPSNPYTIQTGDGKAEGVINLFRNPLPKYFTKIARNHRFYKATPKKGDIIVWSGSLPGSGGAGHIAICLA